MLIRAAAVQGQYLHRINWKLFRNSRKRRVNEKHVLSGKLEQRHFQNSFLCVGLAVAKYSYHVCMTSKSRAKTALWNQVDGSRHISSP